MKRYCIGDTHGAWDKLNQILQKIKSKDPHYQAIHVGDIGLGFALLANDPKSFPKNLEFIRGNHDNPAACRKYPNYLGDYGFDKNTGIFHISGAWSVDRDYRTQDIDWWHDEELDYSELQKVIDLYTEIKPDFVISHTCPSSIGKMLTSPSFCGGKYHGSRTENALESMWLVHKPKLWIFGHWHRKWDKNILGTRFRCLAINEFACFEFKKLKETA